MKRMLSWLILLTPFLESAAAPVKPFELRDGDRVVFLGDTLIERETHYGYVELMMTLQFPYRNVTFRNLGWSADTPEGQSRVSFDWPKGQAEWFRQLLEQVRQAQPTVVVLGYGMASSFDGEAGLERFTTSYNKLIDAILELNRETRFILLSPIRHEKLAPPLPNPARHNEMLASYTKAIQGIAEKRDFPFVNLFRTMEDGAARLDGLWLVTENGIHLNWNGYRWMANLIGDALGWNMKPPMPDPLTQHEELRQTILKKNQLFFNRWRPENSTYLFLFRKHEQGRNAQEIPKFDPLIQAEEQNPLPDKPATPFKPQAPVNFQLADPNLEVTLWAENPLLAKPIHINWDARGRLWVASSSVYPQIEPGQEQDDKILILEDTNGDGQADKTTVFADGLLIPTAVEPGDGGCYVGQSTELLHFKDTDGDGIADQRRTVLSGFGTEDTHHILHTLRWGHDGRLYMNQSIYIHSHLETPHGVVRLNSGGTLALRPDTMELGVAMKGLVNGWGHAFDEFGQSFQTDGAGGQGINWTVPQAMFVSYEGARRILGSVSPGGYPKFCGLELIKSERFPKDWQGNAITCDFRANRVVRFAIDEAGAGYTTKQSEFIRSTNITFRPIDVKLGPDGALYIADWSNPIIQHGEVDFRDPRRDRVHGRIWRVGYKGGKKVENPELVKASIAGLLDQLVSPNGFNHEQAERLLVERAQDTPEAKLPVTKELMKWVARQTNELALLRGVWMQQALGVPVPVPLHDLLEANDPRVRAAAVRVLAEWAGNTPGLPSLAESRLPRFAALGSLSKRVTDDHPRVRLEALRALARIPTARSAELALRVLDQGPVEGFLEYALWLTINDLAEPWVAAVESGAWKIEGREHQLQYALKAIEPKLASGLMAKVIGTKPLPRDGSGGMIELIGQAGGPAQLRQLFDQALTGGFTEEATARALNWLGEAARLRNAKPGGELNTISTLLDATGRGRSDVVRASAAKLAGSWKLAGVAPALSKNAGDANVSLPVRQASIEGLRELGGESAATALRGLAKDGNDSIRRSAASALAATDLKGSMPQIIEVVSATTQEDDALALWRSLLATKGASSAFSKALTTATLPEASARAGLRAAREGGRTDPNLVMALNKAGGLTDASDGLTESDIHSIAYEVTKGNPANGETIYRQKQLGCALCHAIGGAGGKVGPEMTSLGASTPAADYIVESVLLPNKRVKEGFNSVQVTTKEGEELSGNLVRENAEELILRDATAREISIPKRGIATRKMAGSLMPAGLVDFLTPQERLDLYAFLGQLGKPGPFDGTKQNVARVWRVNPKVGTVNADALLASDLRGPDWSLVYSTVSGNLPKTDLMTELDGKDATVWIASRFAISKAGPVRLKMSGTASPKVWVDGKPIGGEGDMLVDLPAGPHTFFIKVTTTDIIAPLRLESDDATFLVE